MRRTMTWTLAAFTAFALAGAASAATRPPEKDRPEIAGLLQKAAATLGYGNTRTTFRYPGAEYVKVHFARVLLLPGDYLTVSSPDGQESHAVTKPGWAM